MEEVGRRATGGGGEGGMTGDQDNDGIGRRRRRRRRKSRSRREGGSRKRGKKKVGEEETETRGTMSWRLGYVFSAINAPTMFALGGDGTHCILSRDVCSRR